MCVRVSSNRFPCLFLGAKCNALSRLAVFALVTFAFAFHEYWSDFNTRDSTPGATWRPAFTA